MGYKIKSGKEIIDDEGNLVIAQGARLYVSDTVYANNVLGINNQDVANVFNSAGYPQFSVLRRTTPFHIGYEYGYFAGGDKATVSVPTLQVDTPGPDYINNQPRLEFQGTDEQENAMNTNYSNVSKFPFAISSSPAVVDHSELTQPVPAGPAPSGNEISQNQVLGANLSDGVAGYVAGGFTYKYTALPAPSSTISHIELATINKFSFAVPAPATWIGDLASNSFLTTGHSSKNGHGYVIGGQVTDEIQKFSFASFEMSSFSLSPGPVGIYNSPSPYTPGVTMPTDVYEHVASPVTAQPGTPDFPGPVVPVPSRDRHYHVGWTNGEEAIIAGHFPLGSPAPSAYSHMHIFNMASETYSTGGVNLAMATGPDIKGPDSGTFPYQDMYGGVSVASLTDGYWIGTGDAGPSSANINDNNIRRFPFANHTESVASAGDMGYGSTLFDHGEGHFVADNPFHGATGFSSIDEGFISSQTQKFSPVFGSPFNTVQTGLEKFPFASVTNISDIYEVSEYLTPSSSGSKFKSSMGTGGIVS
jgi:hypothetical protein